MSGEPVVRVVAEQLRRPVPGGIGTYVRGLLGGLADERDVRVSSWSSRLPPQIRSRLWDRGIGRLRADVVHAPSLAFPKTDGRLVVAVHDLAWRDAPETYPERGRRWHERAFRRALEVADHFVVPSALTAGRMAEAGVAPGAVTLIEYGADHLPAPDVDAARGLVAGDFLVTVGTQEPRKNLTGVLDAFSRARHELPDGMRLVVVGPQGWGDDLVARDGVVVVGSVPAATLAGLYRRAAALVYVPLIEGFGFPPAEAMHVGTPVVTSVTVPSSAGAGLEVDPRDVDAIAGAMVRVTVDRSVREDLIRRGADRARVLTWRVAAQRHVELWKSLL